MDRLLSVVVSVYNEEKALEDFYKETTGIEMVRLYFQRTFCISIIYFINDNAVFSGKPVICKDLLYLFKFLCVHVFSSVSFMYDNIQLAEII